MTAPPAFIDLSRWSRLPTVSLRVLTVIADEPGSTMRDIMSDLGMASETVTSSLRFLLRAGVVERSQSAPRPIRGGRRQWCYRLASQVDVRGER
jgi:DNA-binding MarR family transcriptional regulator